VSTGSAPSESAALNMATAGLALTTVRSRIVAPAGPVLPVCAALNGAFAVLVPGTAALEVGINVSWPSLIFYGNAAINGISGRRSITYRFFLISQTDEMKYLES
jgi:hypothetical protein